MLSKETVSRMEETFTLTEAEELELLESIAQIDRGDYVTFDQLLALLSQTPPTD